MRIISYIYFVLGLITSLDTFAESVRSSPIQKMDRIIAVVDQSVITEQELVDRMASIKMQLEKKRGRFTPRKCTSKANP